MDLKQLKAAGGFSSNKLIPVTKKWTTPEGEEVDFDFFVVPPSCGQKEDLVKMIHEKKDFSYYAKSISEGIRIGENGKTKLSYEEAYDLNLDLANLFLEAIQEAEKPKKAKSAENSGTN